MHHPLRGVSLVVITTDIGDLRTTRDDLPTADTRQAHVNNNAEAIALMQHWADHAHRFVL